MVAALAIVVRASGRRFKLIVAALLVRCTHAVRLARGRNFFVLLIEADCGAFASDSIVLILKLARAVARDARVSAVSLAEPPRRAGKAGRARARTLELTSAALETLTCVRPTASRVELAGWACIVARITRGGCGAGLEGVILTLLASN